VPTSVVYGRSFQSQDKDSPVLKSFKTLDLWAVWDRMDWRGLAEVGEGVYGGSLKARPKVRLRRSCHTAFPPAGNL
jgi:hypothetical protein